jgi:uncharacterized protein (DUF4415 family)
MDLNNPPVLSEEQKARLEALAKRPDSEIDFSDIPELDDSFWKNAVQNPFYKPTKQVTTVRMMQMSCSTKSPRQRLSNTNE